MKRISLVLLLIVAIGLTGCFEESSESVSGYSLIEEAKLKAEQEVNTNKLTREEEFEKHYRNGLYFEDFGDTADVLNELMTPVVQEKYEELPFWPVIARSKMEFYNLTLKQYRDGDITFEEIVSNPESYIRNWNVWLYYFVDYKTHSDEMRIELLEYLENETINYEISGGAKCDFNMFFCEDEYLVESRVEKAMIQEDIGKYLRKKANPYWYFYFENGSFSSSNIFGTDELIGLPLEYTNEKYNEKFKMLGLKDKNLVLAPVRNPKLKFQVGDGDRYLSVLVQSIMTEKVKAFIEEEGMTGKILPLVVPTDNSYTRNSMNELAYDTGEGFDPDYFIENVYEGNYDFSLFYLVDKKADIDYALLQRLMGKIYDIPYNEENSLEGEFDWTKNIFTFFYETTDEDRKIISKMFEEESVTTGGFPEKTTMANITSTMHSVRADTDAFVYLDVYTKKLPFIMRTSIDPMEKSLEHFIKYMKDKSLFEY